MCVYVLHTFLLHIFYVRLPLRHICQPPCLKQNLRGGSETVRVDHILKKEYDVHTHPPPPSKKKKNQIKRTS